MGLRSGALFIGQVCMFLLHRQICNTFLFKTTYCEISIGYLAMPARLVCVGDGCEYKLQCVWSRSLSVLKRLSCRPKGLPLLHEMIGLRISKMLDYFSPPAVSCL